MAHQSGTLKKALRCTKCKFPLAGRWMDALMAARAATFSEGLHYTEIWCNREEKTAVLQLNWVKNHCALELKYAIKVVARGIYYTLQSCPSSKTEKKNPQQNRKGTIIVGDDKKSFPAFTSQVRACVLSQHRLFHMKTFTFT